MHSVAIKIDYIGGICEILLCIELDLLVDEVIEELVELSISNLRRLQFRKLRNILFAISLF